MSIMIARRGTIAGRGTGAAPETLLETQLADGAVLAMPFNEAIVSPADYGPTHLNPSVPVAGLTSIADGPLGGRAYHFDGSADNRVQIADHAALDLGDIWSVECFVRKGATGGTIRSAIGKSSDGTNAAYLMQFASSGALLSSVKTQAVLLAHSSVTLDDTTNWHHCVITKNGSTRKVYLDGVDVTVLDTDGVCGNNDRFFTVGCSYVASQNFEEEFTGDIAYVALYPTALAVDRVLAHATATTGSTPSAIPLSNLQLWLRAEDIGLTDGAPVTTWTDKSFSGNNATSVGTAPIYKTGIKNGKAVVRFDGTKYMNLTAAVGATNAPRTCIFVVKNADAANGSVILGRSTEAWGYVYLWLSSVQAQSNSDQTISGEFTPDGQFRIGEYWCNGVNSKCSYDGNVGALDSDNGVWTPDRIGYFSNSIYMMDGDIAEILVWNRALSLDERRAVTAELASYYDITAAVPAS